MFRNRTNPNQFRSLVVAVLGFSLSGGGQLIAQPVAAPAAPVDYKALRAELNDAFAKLEDAVGQIPADNSDPQALIEQLGRDPAKLHGWVRDNTHYAPYRGSLRGAAGVLQDRLGSSLDRALLLAELLRAAGFDVRLASGAVADPAKATAAIRPIPANWLTAARPVAEDNAELKASNDLAAARTAAASARVTKHAEELLKQLSASGLVAAKTTDATTFADALKDHWWVQLKQGDNWVDADPTLPTAKLGDRLAEATTTLAAPGDTGRLTSLPPEQIHAVELKVIVERLEGGKLTEASPLSISLRPAELQGKRVVFNHVPVAYKIAPAATSAEQGKALAAVTEYMPVIFVGGSSTVENSVTDAGQINTSPSLDRTAGMGKATGNVLGGLDGGLSGASAQQATSVWTAEWLEFTVRAPGRPAKTIRREVFDLIGPSARAKAPIAAPKLDEAVRLDRSLALVGETDILAFGVHPSAEFLAGQYAQTLMKTKRRVMAAVDARIAAPNGAKLKPIDFDVRKLALSPAWGVATGRLAVSPVAGDVYLDAPNVFCMTRRARVGVDGAVTQIHRTDLAANDVAVRAGVDAFAARVRQGVADTVMEAVLVETLGVASGTDAGKAINTVNLFDAAGEGPVGIPSRAADLSVWPADARTRAEQSVAGGAVLVATAKPAAPAVPTRLSGQVGWWKVDPTTGTTIGVTGDGYHAATTDRTLIEARINALTDLPFDITINQAKGYTQKEFVKMIAGGKGLSGMRLLRAVQEACRLHELILAL